MLPNINEETQECSSNDQASSSSSSSSQSKMIEADAFLNKLNGIVVDQDGSSSTPDAKEYRNHYETLLGALKLANTREASLVGECQNIRAQHDTSIAKFTASNSAKTSQVKTLEKDLSTLKSLLESANIREDRAKGAIGKLQVEFEELTESVYKSEISTAQKDSEIKQLSNDVEEWKGKAAVANDKVAAMEIKNNQLSSQNEQLNLSCNELKSTKASLEALISQKNEDIKRGNDKNDRVNCELENVQKTLDSKTQECTDERQAHSVTQSKITSLEKQLIDAKKLTAVKEEELEYEITKTTKLNEIKLEQKKELNEQAEELSKANLLLKKSEIECSRLLADKTQLERKLEAEKKSIQRQQQLIDDAKAATRLSSDEVNLLQKELDQFRKQEIQLNREVTMLKRENALQLSKIQTTEDKVRQSGIEVQNNSLLIASLEKEVADAKDETFKQVRENTRSQKECDGLRSQLKLQMKDSQQLMDDIKVKGDQEKELSREIDELKCEVEHQRKKYEDIRVEMNNTLQLLETTQRNVVKLDNEKKSTLRLVDTLRAEISTKDSALVKEHYECSREKSQKQIYAEEISRLKKTIQDKEDSVRTYQSEIRQLSSGICQLEDTAAINEREKQRVIHERDILGTSLQRRNTELALLYEKIKILQSTNRLDGVEYSSRMDDIRILKIKVRYLQRQLIISQGSQAGVDSVSRNLMLVQKELVRERLKVKALSDELENPINVHRWRKLEGTDPDNYEMMQKIQLLQKRLLNKSDEIVKQNTIIQDQANKLNDLETTLARAPSSDIAEQLSSAQTDIRKKNRQLKAMASEMNMQETQVKEAKQEAEELAIELHNTKKRYFEERKRNQTLVKENELGLLSELSPSTLIKPLKDQSNNRTRFLGGGFAIK